MKSAFTKKFLKRNLTKLNRSKLFRSFSNKKGELLKFKTRWETKKMTQEELTNHHQEMFEQMDFKQLETPGVFLFYKSKRTTADTVYSLLFWLFSLPLTIFGLMVAYALIQKVDDPSEKKRYTSLLKMTKLLDITNNKESSYYKELLYSLKIIDEVNEKYNYEEPDQVSLYDDKEFKKLFLRSLYEDMPIELNQDQKVDILMMYDESIKTKFKYATTGSQIFTFNIVWTAITAFLVWKIRRKDVRKMVVDFNKKAINMKYHYISRTSSSVVNFREAAFQKEGDNMLLNDYFINLSADSDHNKDMVNYFLLFDLHKQNLR